MFTHLLLGIAQLARFPMFFWPVTTLCGGLIAAACIRSAARSHARRNPW